MIGEEDLLDDGNDENYDDILNDSEFTDDLLGDEGLTTKDRNNDLLKGLTDFEVYLKDKINGYLGLVWDDEKQKYVKSEYLEPIINKKGAAWLIDNLKTYVRANNLVTFVREEHYNEISCDIIDVLWYSFAVRAKRVFGVKYTSDILKICTEMEHAAKLVLMGSGGGKFMDFLGSSTQRHETVQLNPAMQQQGYMVGAPVQQQKASFMNKAKKMILGG